MQHSMLKTAMLRCCWRLGASGCAARGVGVPLKGALTFEARTRFNLWRVNAITEWRFLSFTHARHVRGHTRLHCRSRRSRLFHVSFEQSDYFPGPCRFRAGNASAVAPAVLHCVERTADIYDSVAGDVYGSQEYSR